MNLHFCGEHVLQSIVYGILNRQDPTSGAKGRTFRPRTMTPSMSNMMPKGAGGSGQEDSRLVGTRQPPSTGLHSHWV